MQQHIRTKLAAAAGALGLAVAGLGLAGGPAMAASGPVGCGTPGTGCGITGNVAVSSVLSLSVSSTSFTLGTANNVPGQTYLAQPSGTVGVGTGNQNAGTYTVAENDVAGFQVSLFANTDFVAGANKFDSGDPVPANNTGLQAWNSGAGSSTPGYTYLAQGCGANPCFATLADQSVSLGGTYPQAYQLMIPNGTPPGSYVASLTLELFGN